MPLEHEHTGLAHRKRLKRDDASGDARFLTFSCFRRQPFLSKDRSRIWLLDALVRSRATHGFHLWAYVVMPEHVHVLIWPGPTPALVEDVLYTLKKSVTSRALAYVRAHVPEFLPHMEDRQPSGDTAYRFWQRGGGYDENLWREAKIWQKIEYIHANPVRRGLCQSPADWPWSSARAYAEYVHPRRRSPIGSGAMPTAVRVGMESMPTAVKRGVVRVGMDSGNAPTTLRIIPVVPIDFESLPNPPTRVVR